MSEASSSAIAPARAIPSFRTRAKRLLPFLPLVLVTSLLARSSIQAVLAKLGHPGAALDDAYIHFQYARAFAEGHPLRFQAGEPISTGATSFLWPAILAVPYALGAPRRVDPLGDLGALVRRARRALVRDVRDREAARRARGGVRRGAMTLLVRRLRVVGGERYGGRAVRVGPRSIRCVAPPSGPRSPRAAHHASFASSLRSRSSRRSCARKVRSRRSCSRSRSRRHRASTGCAAGPRHCRSCSRRQRRTCSSSRSPVTRRRAPRR